MIICPIASGSSGNCVYVGTDSTHIIIDTGVSKKRIEEGLDYVGVSPDSIDAVLITHEHSDHISGLGVFERKYPTRVYGTDATLDYIENCGYLGKIDTDEFCPVDPDEVFMIGDIEVTVIKTSHDAACSVAYILRNDGKSIAVATDLGTFDDHIVEALKGMDVMLLEANHDIRMLETGPYPYQLKRRILSDAGHLSNEMAGKLLCEVLHDGLRTIILGHLSKENNYPALAYEAVRMEIDMGDNPYSADDFNMVVAKPGEPTGIFEA
ncbi:MAG: MBL fold metallo-hydrolase [Lachnospiraceae bacterium]|nr:MBL fold metallo-hydrolase [Lachnospiraceae bacterium]